MKTQIKKFWFELALLIGGLLVVSLGLGGFLIGGHLGGSEYRAQIGDFVGGTTTPILTALTFIGVLVGIALQRRELIATREELERSSSALEKQVEHLEKQQLSQSFFDLFEMYKSVVAEISTGSHQDKETGKAALQKFSFFFFRRPSSGPIVWDFEQVQITHDRYNPNLGNYFRIIFRLLSFLAEHEERGDFYADMFRAQLTTSELYLLFFNCMSTSGRPLEEYAVKYELFDNMPIPAGEGFSALAREMDPKSFGQNIALHDLYDSAN